MSNTNVRHKYDVKRGARNYTYVLQPRAAHFSQIATNSWHTLSFNGIGCALRPKCILLQLPVIIDRSVN